jgi:hypothetical protein
MGSVEALAGASTDCVALAIFAIFAALASAARFFFAFSPMVDTKNKRKLREYIQEKT